MKISLFSKREDGQDSDDGQAVDAIVPVGEAEIEVTSDGVSDLALYEQVELDMEPMGGKAFFDRLIPLAGAAADAAAQYDHAVVRFPEGAKWQDLLNRKSPGWEDWKTLTPFKDKKFQAQAAIKQVKLSPAAVANIALQGAAIAVGQAYMTEINQQLESIEAGIASIQQEMQMEREARLEADFEMLREYAELYGEISQHPEKRQAVFVAIEDIRKDVREAWNFQMKAMDALNKKLASGKRMKDQEVRSSIREFQSREADVLAVYQLLISAEQVSMQYDGNFSVERLERERQRIQERLDEYEAVRFLVQASLNRKIEKVRGDLVAIPAAEEDAYEARNPLFDAAHVIGHNAPRFTPLALRKEAGKQLKDKKRRYSESASIDNPIAPIADARSEDLNRMDFMYNQADSLMIDEGSIRFLKTLVDEAGKEEDGQD